MNPRKRGVMPAWAHVGFWIASAVLAMMVTVTGFAALAAGARNAPPPNPVNTVYLLASAAGLVILFAIWRRYWFLPSDLAAVLKARNGRVERSRAAKRVFRGRIGDLWLLASLDRPVRDYWPGRMLRITRHGMEPRYGLKPDYMLRSARVEVVRPGDFRGLPQLTINETARSLSVETARTGDPSLDRALRDAALAMRDPDTPVIVAITDRSLRVETVGGSWLGARFGDRVEDLLAFMNRLLTSLSGRYTPTDVDAWLPESDGEVRRLFNAREAGMRATSWKVLPFAALLLLPCAARASTPEAAASFLVVAQESDGGWTSRFARRAHTTSEVLRALQTLGSSPAVRAAAADLLQALTIEDVDDRARRIDALAAESRDVAALRSALLAEIAAQGGWPLMAGFAPDPLDTALALVALSPAGSTPDLAASVSLLVAQQNSDGGWPCVADGASEVSCAAEALGALALYRDRFYIDPVLTRGRTFLRSQLNADGSFGPAGADQTYSSALAARALVSAGDDLGSSRPTVIGFLLGRQTADGAWEGDALVTAVALRALDVLRRVPVCGDGLINRATEACDGLDLAGRSCEALGLGEGTLRCSTACTFDTSACAAPPACGDGVRNRSDESCDGLDLGGASCQSIGFIGGTLGCNADCSFNASSCTGVPACGDGIVNRPEEQCDRGDLAGASCSALGQLGGSLTCSPSCLFNTTSCTGTGATEPKALTFGPESALCTAGTETRPVSIAFPPAATVDKVDVFFLFDDTGSFAGRVPTVTGIFNSLVTQLQAALPGISLGFGVGRFEDYGGPGSSFSGEFSTGRPFTLNQPIITPDIPGFPTLISNALNRTAPGFGGDGPETTLDALFRVATGTGFDGNGNGSTLNSGVAGATATQTSPGTSGDVPPFTSNVAPTAGTLGGVGFRPRALHLVLVAGDICSVAPYTAGQPIPATITGIGGATVPSSALRCSNVIGVNRFGRVSNSVSTSGNTVAGAIAPAGAATVPETIVALNALGISVIGLADGGTPIRNPVGPSITPSTLMSALALLTGATDATGNPLVFNISGGTTPLRNAIVQAITTAATRPVDVGTRAVEVPADITATLSPGIVPGVGPGGRADFTLQVTGLGVPQGTFRVEFFDGKSNALLGLLPVSLECLPIVEKPADRDGDGFAEGSDCDDQNAAANPGTAEIPGNGIDDDCNPATPDAVPEGELTCTATIENVEYGAHQQVNVEVLLRRTGGSGSLAGLDLALRLAQQSGGQSIGEAVEALAPLGVDERRVRRFAFNTGTTEPGEFGASVEVRGGATVVAACSASARILPSTEAGVSLVGTIQAEPSVVFFRDAITLKYEVTNRGNVELSPAGLEILIVDPLTELVRARLSDAASLAPAATFTGAQPAPAELPVGEYMVILRGGPTNDLRTLATAPLSVRVPPNVAPSCTAAEATAPELWPPNHQFTLVGVQGVTDADGDPVTVAILGVTQDESVLDPGSGNTCPDAIIGGNSVQLRAERAGSGDGRVYRIQFAASDPAGASCTGVVRVCVPRDQSGATCIESPPVVDSTTCPALKK